MASVLKSTSYYGETGGKEFSPCRLYALKDCNYVFVALFEFLQ